MTTYPLFPSENLLDEARASERRGLAAQAEALFKKAIDERIKVVGAGDGSVGDYQHELGRFQLAQGNFATAEETLKKAVETLQGAYYALHARLIPALDDLSDLYLKQDKFAEAETTLVKLLDVVDKTLSGDHRRNFETLHKLGYVYRRLGKSTDAEKTLLKALKTIDTPLGPAEEFKLDLALTYQETGKDAEAETNFKQAIAGFNQRSNFPRMAEALEAYAAFLRKKGRNDHAKLTDDLAGRVRATAGSAHPEDIFPATLLRA